MCPQVPQKRRRSLTRNSHAVQQQASLSLDTSECSFEDLYIEDTGNTLTYATPTSARLRISIHIEDTSIYIKHVSFFFEDLYIEDTGHTTTQIPLR
jgi:hypothetical protein